MDDIKLVQDVFEEYLLILDAEKYMFNMPMDVQYKFDSNDLLHPEERVSILTS